MLTSKTLVRRMSSLVSSLVCKEVTVPVPWGVISAKQWSNPGPAHHQSEGREVKQGNVFFILIIISAGAGGAGAGGRGGARRSPESRESAPQNREAPQSQEEGKVDRNGHEEGNFQI